MRRIQIRFQQLGTQATQAMEDSVQSETEKLRQKIKDRCPVRTGKLRDSIELKRLKVSAKVVRYQVKQNGRKAWYGKIIERGTPTKRGKFFMRGTYYHNKQSTAEAIKNTIRRRLGL